MSEGQSFGPSEERGGPDPGAPGDPRAHGDSGASLARGDSRVRDEDPEERNRLPAALLQLDSRLARALRGGDIRAVTFDVAGTLVGLREPVGGVYARVAARHGIELSAEALQDAFDVLFRRMPPLAFPPLPQAEVENFEREWWRQLVLMVATEAHREVDPTIAFEDAWGDAFPDFFEELYESYGHAERWRPYDDAADALARLADAGLTLGVVTNFDSRVEGLLAELNLLEPFDAVTVSSRAGAAKPNPMIFLAALAALDAEPRESVHVGDDLLQDWGGAIEAGMHALIVDRRGRPPRRDDVTAVADLKPLPLLLGAGP